MRRHPVAARVAPVNPVRVSEPPRTEVDRQALERNCREAAKRLMPGASQARRRIRAAQLYNAAVEEAQRAVREPLSQPSLIHKPSDAVPHPEPPRGMAQRDSGLYVPGGNA